jgi:hypothetical protein
MSIKKTKIMIFLIEKKEKKVHYSFLLVSSKKTILHFINTYVY